VNRPSNGKKFRSWGLFCRPVFSAPSASLRENARFPFRIGVYLRPFAVNN
jgi:hypothetical protein